MMRLINLLIISLSLIAVIGCDSDLGNKSNNIKIMNDTKSFSCEEFTTTNYEHVQANRAVAGGMMDLYAITVGGNDDLGLVGSIWYSTTTTVAETSEGHFIKGSCPSDSEPPTVRFGYQVIEPLRFTAGSNLSMRAVAKDNVGVTKVEYTLEGHLLGSATEEPYQINALIPQIAGADGLTTLTITAYDAAGNSASHNVPVDYFWQRPQAHFGHIRNNIYGTIKIYAYFTDQQTAAYGTIYVNDTVIFSSTDLQTDCDHESRCVLDFDTTTFPDGEYVIKGVATDPDGNSHEKLVPVKIINNGDQEYPQINSLIMPPYNVPVSGMFTLGADVTDNVGVTKVVIKASYNYGSYGWSYDGDECVKLQAPWTCEFDSTTMKNGQHGIYVEAYDAEGNKSYTSTNNYTIINTDTIAPTISSMSLKDGDTVKGRFNVSGHVRDDKGAVKKFEIYFNDILAAEKYHFDQEVMEYWEGFGNLLLQIDTERSYNPIADGTYTVTLKAIDYADNVTTQTMQITVQNTVPQCTNHRSTNYEHVQAGRATAGGLMNMYAITVGGNDDLGLIGSTWYSTTTDVMETAPSFFEAGVCPQ